MSFTDQKPRKATKQQVVNWGGKYYGDGKRFRCYLCGHVFKVDEYWRWVSATQVCLTNFIVCELCDGPDVLSEWQRVNKELEERFWWAL